MNFSPDDFKEWIQQQNNFCVKMTRYSYVGACIESNIPKKKVAANMCVREGTLKELANDFLKTGGTVVEIDGKNLVVEVNSGSFSIPSKCVRVRY